MGGGIAGGDCPGGGAIFQGGGYFPGGGAIFQRGMQFPRGLLSGWGAIFHGGYCPEGYCPGGYCPGLLPGGYCPGGYCPGGGAITRLANARGAIDLESATRQTWTLFYRRD